MSKEIVVSEADKIAAVIENRRVVEFFLSEGEQVVGDIILASVESIVPAIEAAFLNIGKEKSGFIHVSDIPVSKKRQSGIRNYLTHGQTILVQVTREPTGNKGACLTGFITLPGRFLILTPFERRIGLSKKIYDPKERARLARVARTICGSGYGIALRAEAIGQSEQMLREDLQILLERWKDVLKQSERVKPPATLYRDQDILERVLRDGISADVSRIVVDSQSTYNRAIRFSSSWSDNKIRSKLRVYNQSTPILQYYGVYEHLEKAIQTIVPLPSGGSLVIEPSEALTVIDVNSGSMTSTENQSETILKTNQEAAFEIANQILLRDIGGVIVIDFIDMDNPRDQQVVWQNLSDALQKDKSQPQINYFSEFGLIEMTRRRQRLRLGEILTEVCPNCQGVGRVRNMLYRTNLLTPTGVEARVTGKVAGRAADTDFYREPVEKEEPRYTEAFPEKAPPEEKEAAVSEEKGAVDYDINSLLFDEAYLTGPISEELLVTYIEREENLRVSEEVTRDLDKLIARIDKEGLNSLRPPERPQEKLPEKPGRKAEEFPQQLARQPEELAPEEEMLPEIEMLAAHEEEAPAPVKAEKPQSKAAANREKKAAAAALEAQASAREELPGDEVPETEEAAPVEEEGVEAEEEALVGAPPKGKAKAKSGLGRRRSIRSFRPKK